MLVRRHVFSILAVTATALAIPLNAAAAPPGPAISVVASGLESPFGIDVDAGGVYAAEQGAGQVSRDGKPVLTGLIGPAGVARVGNQIVAVTSGSDAPDAPTEGTASVMAGRAGGSARVVADLLAYELANNPDGQLQFDENGEANDSLSNPFSVIEGRGKPWVLVADGGANDVLAVSKNGDVSTFFVPPITNTGACEGIPNNDPEHTGCDPVPTGLAYGPGNRLYVSTLQSDVPGEGRVYVLNAKTGAILDVISGFSGPTGVAVAPDGAVFVAELFFNAPPGEPPPGFDPSTVGRIVRVAPDGTRTTAQVTMPIGLDFKGGTLYSSAWSVAGLFLGIPAAGQVVAVSQSAFS